VGDRFLILRRGRILGNYEKHEIERDELINLMAGGEDLQKLLRELEQ
jgi:simple sugar transport system ATP-binding protein